MCEIAKRIAPSNYSELCPDPHEVFRAALGDKVFKKLVEEGFAELEPKPRDVYQTPSGKIELYSIGALKGGLPPLPTPPKGDRVEENELLLITSTHPLYTHTQFEEVYGSIYSDLLINPEDAKQLNIEMGNLVEVYNEKGAVKLKIRVDPSRGWVCISCIYL
uniref:Molybdopterin dinucleotide-binding domain-containing protein n=1 Tax=Ignisphaera aggregans TaxID=334771 RepID=A0A7J2U1R8_9CREN